MDDSTLDPPAAVGEMVHYIAGNSSLHITVTRTGRYGLKALIPSTGSTASIRQMGADEFEIIRLGGLVTVTGVSWQRILEQLEDLG